MGILYSKGVRYSGSGKIDATLSTSSANAIANSAVATAINQINSDLTEKLLWTNPSTTSIFTAGDITLSDSTFNYKMIIIKYKWINTGSMFFTQLYYRPDSISETYYLYGAIDSIAVRNFVFDGTRMAFGNAVYYPTYRGTATTSNNLLVPCEIYGRFPIN